jgi:hypothetical protein
MNGESRRRNCVVLALSILLLPLASCGRTSTLDRGEAQQSVQTEPQGAVPATPQDARDGETLDVVGAQKSTWGARDLTAHRVVFADRSSQGYLLLLPAPPDGSPPRAPTRAALRSWVDEAFADHSDLDEIRLLRRLIETDAEAPSAIAPLSTLKIDPNDPASMRRQAKVSDLIGLHVAILETSDVASASILQDPILSRHLSAEDRMSLPRRSYALLLRADYRSREAFRGLRLLQTLVRIASRKLNALILDPDTLEVRDQESFSRARLRSATAAVASQVTVVPFRDGESEAKSVRLTTRGMRRFGTVDLELTGLPLEPAVLQRATDLLYGLALVLVKTAEVDRKGFALEVSDVVTVHWRDIEQAYEGSARELPRCVACPETVEVHLVERPRLPSDPQDHVVAQMVAPRTTSDTASYNHGAWTKRALARMFGG